jgi:hypothetical protein
LHLAKNTPRDGSNQSGDLTMSAATMTADETLKVLKRLKLVARFMDSGWGIPGTKIRFGADSVLGLLPVGGDALGMIISLYVVYKAREIGAPNALLIKMLANIAIDTGVGSVPVLGDVFDVFFKSNIRNTDLLHDFIMKNGKV